MKNLQNIFKKLVKPVSKLLVALSVALMAYPAFAAWDMNMMEGVTPMSHQIFGLHMFAVWVCVGIGLVVYAVMVYSIIYHRKSRGAKAANFHGNTKLEIFWSIIPLIILVVLAIPATQVLGRMEDTKNADITIKITGYQWKWQYEYMDQGISFFSNLSTPIDQIYGNEKKGEFYLLEVDKPLVLPVNRKVRFLVTSSDVIHAWWVPDLGVKRDAIPGFIHEAWANIEKPGIYRGQCAELCGVNHGFMPIVVKAVSDEAFNAWVAEQKAIKSSPQTVASIPATLPAETSIDTQNGQEEILDTELRAWVGLESKEAEVPDANNAVPAVDPSVMTFEQLMSEGKTAYGKYCLVCHRDDGMGMPPVFPALKGSSVAVGKSVARHVKLVLVGVPGTAMQAFADQLTDEEIAAIVTYERNAWGNNTGDLVQVADVVAVRMNPNAVSVDPNAHKGHTHADHEHMQMGVE